MFSHWVMASAYQQGILGQCSTAKLHPQFFFRGFYTRTLLLSDTQCTSLWVSKHMLYHRTIPQALTGRITDIYLKSLSGKFWARGLPYPQSFSMYSLWPPWDCDICQSLRTIHFYYAKWLGLLSAHNAMISLLFNMLMNLRRIRTAEEHS